MDPVIFKDLSAPNTSGTRLGGTRQIPNPHARLIHAIMADKINILRAKNVAPEWINSGELGSKSLRKPDLVRSRGLKKFYVLGINSASFENIYYFSKHYVSTYK